MQLMHRVTGGLGGGMMLVGSSGSSTVIEVTCTGSLSGISKTAA